MIVCTLYCCEEKTLLFQKLFNNNYGISVDMHTAILGIMPRGQGLVDYARDNLQFFYAKV